MRWPAEWEPHEAVWIGFPGNPTEWPVGLDRARAEVAAFANLVSDDGAGEQVHLVCRDQRDAARARALVAAEVDIIIEPFGDIWLRDTGPTITSDEGGLIANQFGFNGWGAKFEMPGDQDIGLRLSSRQVIRLIVHDWVLEGGAIDGNGNGAILTTEQCILNANRNRALDSADILEKLQFSLATDEVIWLRDGMVNDHTDGHVDNLARFVDQNTVAVPQSEMPDDPNIDRFEHAADQILKADFNLIRLPSVGRYDIDGEIAPASYMNFYIGNTVIAVPQYGAAQDQQAVDAIAKLFPSHKVEGLFSTALLRGGGSFHCISQQIPKL